MCSIELASTRRACAGAALGHHHATRDPGGTYLPPRRRSTAAAAQGIRTRPDARFWILGCSNPCHRFIRELQEEKGLVLGAAGEGAGYAGRWRSGYVSDAGTAGRRRRRRGGGRPLCGRRRARQAVSTTPWSSGQPSWAYTGRTAWTRRAERRPPSSIGTRTTPTSFRYYQKLFEACCHGKFVVLCSS